MVVGVCSWLVGVVCAIDRCFFSDGGHQWLLGGTGFGV